MKVKALRSFLMGVDGDGNRDVIEAGEVRDITKDQFKDLSVHGLVEATKEDEAAWASKQKSKEKEKKD